MELFLPKNLTDSFTTTTPERSITAPTMIVVINKPLPKILPTAIKIPSSSYEARTAQRKSGTPFANAMSVTLYNFTKYPAKVYDMLKYSAINVTAGDR